MELLPDCAFFFPNNPNLDFLPPLPVVEPPVVPPVVFVLLIAFGALDVVVDDDMICSWIGWLLSDCTYGPCVEFMVAIFF